MKAVVPLSAQVFKRAIIMPNLRPPVVSAKQVCEHLPLWWSRDCAILLKTCIITLHGDPIPVQAMEYRSRILQAVPDGIDFEPLMTLYLTDETTPDDVLAAKEKGVVAYKLYPAGATTNSDSGVTDINRCIPTLQAIAEV